MKKQNLLIASLLSLGLMFNTTGCNSTKVTKIGILQYVNDPALNENYNGFVSVLEKELEKGSYEIDLKIAAADASINTAGADNLVSKCDLLFGIATPSATALSSACYLANKNTPILFSAVTDPVSCGLVSSLASPGGNITGTTDMNPVADQIALIKELIPSASKVGIIYTTSEQNSIIQKNLAKAKCDELKLELVDKSFSSISELDSSIAALKQEKIDALYVPTDNNCAANIATIMSQLSGEKILVVAGEANLLTSGAHVSLGVDYFKLGEATGKMAVDIIKNNKKPSDIPVTGGEAPLYVNQTSMEDFGFTLTAEFLAKAIIKNTGK